MRFLFLLVMMLLAALPVRAHDYWLFPATFFPDKGVGVAVRLFVGDDFVSEAERPFQKNATVRFQHVAKKDTIDLTPRGEEDKTPLVSLKFAEAGTHLLALERAPRDITLEADKFNKYLAEEGLDAILKQRKKAGEDRKPGRERYRRYLKTLLQVGPAPDDTACKVLGLKLEIVPLANPAAVKIGNELTLRVLFEGKPLTGAKVFAHRRHGEKVTTATAITSAEGKVTFRLDGEGAWLIRLVTMSRSTEAGADWESFWAALTFGVK